MNQDAECYDFILSFAHFTKKRNIHLNLALTLSFFLPSSALYKWSYTLTTIHQSTSFMITDLFILSEYRERSSNTFLT